MVASGLVTARTAVPPLHTVAVGAILGTSTTGVTVTVTGTLSGLAQPALETSI